MRHSFTMRRFFTIATFMMSTHRAHLAPRR